MGCAKDAFGQKNVWSQDGAIFALVNGRKVKFTNQRTLDNELKNLARPTLPLPTTQATPTQELLTPTEELAHPPNVNIKLRRKQ